MARSGLKKVVKSVKGKRGSVKRSYWVKAASPAPKKGRGARAGGKAGGAMGVLRNHYVQSALAGFGAGAIGHAASARGAGQDIARVGMNAAKLSSAAGGSRTSHNTMGFGVGLAAHAGTQVLAAQRNKSHLGTWGATMAGSVAGHMAAGLFANRIAGRAYDREAQKRYKAGMRVGSAYER